MPLLGLTGDFCTHLVSYNFLACFWSIISFLFKREGVVLLALLSTTCPMDLKPLIPPVLFFVACSNSPDKSTLWKQPLAVYLGCTSLAPRSCLCSLCTARCAGAHRHRKSESRLTTVPTAIQDRADHHTVGCRLAAAPCRMRKTGLLFCPDTQHSSWTSQHHSS